MVVDVSDYIAFAFIETMLNLLLDLAVSLFDLTSLFLITQTKAQNIPLYLLFRLQTVFLSTHSPPIVPYTQLT